MTNSELIKMIKANDEMREFKTTTNIKATYFIDTDGKQWSFGYEYGYRTNDHRIIFGLIENIDRNDFDKLIRDTGLLVYMPESNEGLFLSDLELSDKQKRLVNRHNIEIIFE